jgi:hypothetical protein
MALRPSFLPQFIFERRDVGIEIVEIVILRSIHIGSRLQKYSPPVVIDDYNARLTNLSQSVKKLILGFKMAGMTEAFAFAACLQTFSLIKEKKYQSKEFLALEKKARDGMRSIGYSTLEQLAVYVTIRRELHKLARM